MVDLGEALGLPYGIISMNVHDLVSTDADVLGGTSVFNGHARPRAQSV